MIRLLLYIVAITFVNIGQSIVCDRSIHKCDTKDTIKFYEVSCNITNKINRLVSVVYNKYVVLGTITITHSYTLVITILIFMYVCMNVARLWESL